MRKRNRLTRGFTLVEILIALVVLTIGLCGIVALFPAGVYSTRESMEDTTASQIAESVYAAIVVALRDAPSATQAYFIHDGTTPNGYLFNLPIWPMGQPQPPTVAQLVKVPTMGTGTTLAPNNHLFQCAYVNPPGGPPNPLYPINGTCRNIKGVPGATPPVPGFDPTENYDQYSFSFDLIRLGQLGLYEVRIGVYRNYEVAATHPVTGQGSWGGGQWGPSGALWHVCTSLCVGVCQRHPNLKHIFRALVAGQ